MKLDNGWMSTQEEKMHLWTAIGDAAQSTEDHKHFASQLCFLYAKLSNSRDTIHAFLNLIQGNVFPKKIGMLSFVKQQREPYIPDIPESLNFPIYPIIRWYVPNVQYI